MKKGKPTAVDRAIAVVRRWGVEVVVGTPIEKSTSGFYSKNWRSGGRQMHSAPSHHAWIEVDENKKPIRIWWAEPAVSMECACGIIHEAAHVLVGVNPDLVDEVDSPMLWWEYEMQKEAGVLRARNTWMANFGVQMSESDGDIEEWRSLTRSLRQRVMRWSKGHADLFAGRI